ncbi:hypothetical protein M405DRAFT_815019 [Rhizopogon salebrosus TDB-379]|nr:hypothetical protein M405DRAFT_815019 [Rhizopogon salebrosus TDB-379]
MHNRRSAAYTSVWAASPAVNGYSHLYSRLHSRYILLPSLVASCTTRSLILDPHGLVSPSRSPALGHVLQTKLPVLNRTGSGGLSRQ